MLSLFLEPMSVVRILALIGLILFLFGFFRSSGRRQCLYLGIGHAFFAVHFAGLAYLWHEPIWYLAAAMAGLFSLLRLRQK